MALYANSDNDFAITLTDLSDVPHDITSWTFRLDLKPEDCDTPLVQLTIGSGLSIPTGTDGLLTGEVTGAQVVTLLDGHRRGLVMASLWRTDGDDVLLAYGRNEILYIGARD